MQIRIGKAGHVSLQTPGDTLKERIIVTSHIDMVPVRPIAVVTDTGRIMRIDTRGRSFIQGKEKYILTMTVI
jgi:hypothetical protein